MKIKLFRPIFLLFAAPFSFFWEWIYVIRRFAYKHNILRSEEFQIPILSVGNIVFGGSGKTPFTLWISELIESKQKKVMILSRGYKGKLENGRGLLSGNRKLGLDPVDYGDEPLLLKKRLKNASIVVGKKRSENLAYYFDSENPDVVLLDDGHQHHKLRRDLNIVLFDSLMEIDRYKVAPRGYLREGLSALRDADIIIFGRCDQVSEKKLKVLRDMIKSHTNPKTLFGNIYYRSSGIFNRNHIKVMNLDDLRGRNIICIAGIASPVSFFNQFGPFEVNIVEKIVFPDHHYFKADEINPILKRAEESQALVITTEKDMVKMRRIISGDKVLYLGIEVHFAKGEEEITNKIMTVI